MTIGPFNSPDATRSLNAETGPVAFAVAEPADPCRQALEGTRSWAFLIQRRNASFSGKRSRTA